MPPIDWTDKNSAAAVVLALVLLFGLVGGPWIGWNHLAKDRTTRVVVEENPGLLRDKSVVVRCGSVNRPLATPETRMADGTFRPTGVGVIECDSELYMGQVSAWFLFIFGALSWITAIGVGIWWAAKLKAGDSPLRKLIP